MQKLLLEILDKTLIQNKNLLKDKAITEDDSKKLKMKFKNY